MRKTWEKLVQHVGTKYGQDIRNEMHNKTVVNITEHVHAPQVLVSHATQNVLVYTFQNNIQTDHREQSTIIRESATAYPTDAELP